VVWCGEERECEYMKEGRRGRRKRVNFSESVNENESVNEIERI